MTAQVATISDTLPVRVTIVALADDAGSNKQTTYSIDGDTSSAHNELSALLTKYPDTAYSIVTLGVGNRSVTLTVAPPIQTLQPDAGGQQIAVFIVRLTTSPNARIQTSSYTFQGTVQSVLAQVLQQYPSQQWTIYSGGGGANHVSLTFMHNEGWDDKSSRQLSAEPRFV